MSKITPLRRADGSAEFTCIGCGIRVIQVVAHAAEPKCLTCRAMPNWQDDERLSRLFGEYKSALCSGDLPEAGSRLPLVVYATVLAFAILAALSQVIG